MGKRSGTVPGNRLSASRFLTTAYLSLPTTGEYLKTLCLSELRRNRPTYIVLAWMGSTTPALPDPRKSYEQFTQLRDLVERDSYLEKAETGFELYRLSSP